MISRLALEGWYSDSINTLHEALYQDDYDTLDKVLGALQEVTRMAMKRYDGIHLPELDQIILKLANKLHNKNIKTKASPRKSILLVSELYLHGGHSRIVEDIIDLMSGSCVVLITDYIGNYANGRLRLGEIYNRLEGAAVITLPEGSNISKTISAINTINLVSPHKLYLVLHHADSIGYTASRAHSVNGMKTIFLHHADHKPTLGATLNYHKHLDITGELLKNCEDNECKNCVLLPLYAEDHGANTLGIKCSGIRFASVGSRGKFVFEGKLNYSERIVTCLKASDNSTFLHIGQIEQIAIENITNTLSQNGIKVDRFYHIDYTPSVWQTLKKNKVNILIGTAPYGGGRTAIEAQGAGIPVLWYNEGISSIYNAKNLNWFDNESLRGAIRSVCKCYLQYSKGARDFYLKNYTVKNFSKTLELL